MRQRVVLLAAILVALVRTVSAAPAARLPKPAERAGIEQAVYDYLKKGSGTWIRSIRVSTRGPHFPPAAKFYYRTFAVAYLENPRIGPAAVLLGYYIDRLPGWTILNLGSADVGCGLRDSLFHGYKAMVLRDLRLTCH